MVDSRKRRGETFGQAASKVIGSIGSPPPAEPPRSPYACAANGCPLWGSITLDGMRQCFVHSRVADRRHWDSVTAQLVQRPRVIEVIRILRRTDYRERPAVDEAFAVEPRLRERWGSELDVPSRYAVLAALERVLVEDCTDHVDASMHAAAARADTMRQVDEMSARIAARFAAPEALPEAS